MTDSTQVPVSLLSANSKARAALGFGLLAGLIVGALGAAIVITQTTLLDSAISADATATTAASNEPLYWVAPMDPNYRRDQPGKSPMGMDLVPVYAEDTGSAIEGAGAVSVSPHIVQTMGVRTARANKRALSPNIAALGYVRYDEEALMHVHPRVSGWIETLHVAATGDPVTVGEPLYDLYSPELVNAQEELVLALKRGNNLLISAAEDRLRALQLPAPTLAQLKRDRQVQQTVTFYSPAAGVVDDLAVRHGFYVEPGTELFSIGSLDQVWIEADIFEAQAGQIAVGDAATVTVEALPGELWQGKVQYIYPTLDPATRTARVRVRVDNPHHLLKPNMVAHVVLERGAQAEKLTVPREALIRTGRQNRVVLALGEGRFKSIAVKIGLVTPEWAEIRSGLEEGDAVVTSAQFLLDSESSKTSDFQRYVVDTDAMDHAEMDHSAHEGMNHGEMNHD